MVVNDNSRDGTFSTSSGRIPELRSITNSPPNGYGCAVRAGLAAFRGEAVAIVMADGSDSLTSSRTIGSFRKATTASSARDSSGARVVDYPWFKLVFNRIANTFILSLDPGITT